MLSIVNNRSRKNKWKQQQTRKKKKEKIINIHSYCLLTGIILAFLHNNNNF